MEGPVNTRRTSVLGRGLTELFFWWVIQCVLTTNTFGQTRMLHKADGFFSPHNLMRFSVKVD